MMNPQPFKFNSYAEFFDHLTAQEKLMVTILDELIIENVPGIRKKLAYNVPFYYLKKRVFFIWPASIPWGKVKLNGVQLGFCEGKKYSFDQNFFDQTERKQITSKTFFSVAEIEKDLELIVELLNEGERVDGV